MQDKSVEISLEEAFESSAVAGFVASHLMDGVVDSVKALLLSELGKSGLTCGRAVLSFNSHLKVLLGAVGHDLTEQLGEFRCVLRLFV